MNKSGTFRNVQLELEVQQDRRQLLTTLYLLHLLSYQNCTLDFDVSPETVLLVEKPSDWGYFNRAMDQKCTLTERPWCIVRGKATPRRTTSEVLERKEETEKVPKMRWSKQVASSRS